MISDGPGTTRLRGTPARSAPSWRRTRPARRRRGRTCSPAGRDPSCRPVLPADGELRGGAERRRLRLLAAGVRVDLGVEHEDVDVAPAGQHVIEAAVADVVGPAVAADQPDALLHQVVGERFEPPRLGRRERREPLPQRDARARAAPRCRLRVDLIGVEQSPRRGRSPICRRQLLRPAPRAAATCASSASRMPKPNSALSSNSEFDHAGPRPSRLVVYGVVGRLPP